MIKVGCAGMLVEDTFCGPMAALPPEGQLLQLDTMPVKAGGCAANVAIDLAKQGLRVEVVGCLGRDSSAEVLLTCLRGHGIDCAQVVRVDDFPTSKTVILLVTGEDRRYLHVFGSNRTFTVAHISRSWIRTLGVFYLGGLCALPSVLLPELRELLWYCREHRVTTVVDVVIAQASKEAPELMSLLPFVDYFLPNHDEAQKITGEADNFAQLRAFRAAGANCVVVTKGPGGAVASVGGRYWECGAFPVDCVDPSGSGDAFSAGIITGVAHGWPMPRLLRYASALGASATRGVGTTDTVFSNAQTEAFASSHQLDERAGVL